MVSVGVGIVIVKVQDKPVCPRLAHQLDWNRNDDTMCLSIRVSCQAFASFMNNALKHKFTFPKAKQFGAQKFVINRWLKPMARLN